MSTNPNQTIIDCRGMQCPAPIVAIAKAAKQFGPSGGVLHVVADDEAFPLDVKSWCRSAKATMMQLKDTEDGYRATIRVGVRTSSKPAKPQVVSSRAPVSTPLTVIDCVGQSCPQPIITLAKRAKQLAGQEVEIHADDPAFPLDVRSWCRSSGAKILEMDETSLPFRARLRIRAAAPSSRTESSSRRGSSRPGAGRVTASYAARSAPAAEGFVRPAAEAAPIAVDGDDHLRIDLSWFAPEERLTELVRSLQEAAPVGEAAVIAPDASFNSTLMEWCVSEGHILRSLTGAGPVVAEISVNAARLGTAVDVQEEDEQTTALVPTVANDRCSLLVLHNDHEALLAALLVANGAAASGMDVSIFFTFWGLNLLRGDEPNPAAPKEKVTWVQRLFKWMMPGGAKRQKLGQMNFGGAGRGMLNSIMKSQNIMQLPELVDSAQSQGVHFIACTMSMSVMGITKRDLHPYEHMDYGGVATFVEKSRHAAMHMVF